VLYSKLDTSCKENYWILENFIPEDYSVFQGNAVHPEDKADQYCTWCNTGPREGQ